MMMNAAERTEYQGLAAIAGRLAMTVKDLEEQVIGLKEESAAAAKALEDMTQAAFTLEAERDGFRASADAWEAKLIQAKPEPKPKTTVRGR